VKRGEEWQRYYMIIPTNPNDILGIFGISLEIAGFIIAFFAIQPRLPKGGGFTGQWDYLGNVMSTTHKRWSRGAVIIIIIGLVFQLISQALRP